MSLDADDRRRTAPRQRRAEATDGVAVEQPVTVVLAENHATLRRSLRLVLDEEGTVLVLAEASDLATATRHAGRLQPQVLLLDQWLLDQSGIEAVRFLRRHVPKTEIVVVTMDASRARAEQGREAGALGFVLKDAADSELLEAVRLAAGGKAYTSPRVIGTPLAAQRTDHHIPAPLTTPELRP